jgi:cell division protein FtsL
MARRKISKNKKRKLVMFSLFLVLVCFMLFYIWIFNYTNISFKDLEKLKREEANLVTQNRLVAIELDQLSRADRIKQIASSEMDMWTPTPETLAVIITYNEN